MAETEKVKNKFGISKILLLILGILVVLALIAGGSYFYLQYKKSQDLLKNPTLAAQIESQDLVKNVGKLIDLPKDEQPTIATVSDVSKLKDQPFFAKAKNGFKVLIYSKAQKAILYDPIENKIIEVGPVNLGSSQESAPAKAAPIKVALYNGTPTIGLTAVIEKELKDKGLNINIVEKANASSQSAKTLVIDLSGKQKNLVQQIASLLSGELSSLPKGEEKPKDAEILVILGK